METVACRAGFVAKGEVPMPFGELRYQSLHRIRRTVDLADEGTSPSRPASATATETFSFDVSSPT